MVDKANRSATYAAPATISESSLEADLGSAGHISLQLRPDGTQRTAHDCEGKPLRYEGATWVGEFEFHGEEGYTTVSATRLPFSLQPTFRLLCGGALTELHAGGEGLAGASLHIGSRGSQPRVGVSARTNGPGKAVELMASIDEQDGEVEIQRSIRCRRSHTAFSYDPHLAWARLEPPAPFSGLGVYRRDAMPADRWTGSLRVDFPGRSDVPITGGRFQLTLRHGE